MYGGSERICVEVATALADQGHEVSVRLPYPMSSRVWRRTRWVGLDSAPERYDVLFCLDDFQQRDRGDTEALVACRSDPPPHTDFDQLIFLSRTHARLMGHDGRPAVGGGVTLADYRAPKARLLRRVICTSSPDRCRAARAIGRAFDFVHSYKPVPGYDTVELDRDGLIDLQQTARVLIYPLDPSRPSDFFSMAVLEAMAAGTPVVVSDADSMPELWSGAAVVLPRPIHYGDWYEQTERLLADREWWKWHSRRGLLLAQKYDWPAVASRYLEAACQ
jgi:glycosyl transferase family 1